MNKLIILEIIFVLLNTYTIKADTNNGTSSNILKSKSNKMKYSDQPNNKTLSPLKSTVLTQPTQIKSRDNSHMGLTVLFSYGVIFIQLSIFMFNSQSLLHFIPCTVLLYTLLGSTYYFSKKLNYTILNNCGPIVPMLLYMWYVFFNRLVACRLLPSEQAYQNSKTVNEENIPIFTPIDMPYNADTANIESPTITTTDTTDNLNNQSQKENVPPPITDFCRVHIGKCKEAGGLMNIVSWMDAIREKKCALFPTFYAIEGSWIYVQKDHLYKFINFLNKEKKKKWVVDVDKMSVNPEPVAV